MNKHSYVDKLIVKDISNVQDQKQNRQSYNSDNCLPNQRLNAQAS